MVHGRDRRAETPSSGKSWTCSPRQVRTSGGSQATTAPSTARGSTAVPLGLAPPDRSRHLTFLPHLRRVVRQQDHSRQRLSRAQPRVEVRRPPRVRARVAAPHHDDRHSQRGHRAAAIHIGGVGCWTGFGTRLRSHSSPARPSALPATCDSPMRWATTSSSRTSRGCRSCSRKRTQVVTGLKALRRVGEGDDRKEADRKLDQVHVHRPVGPLPVELERPGPNSAPEQPDPQVSTSV